ncbi:MAG: RsmD family RNA methyltransferase [Actinomycetota bacterium]
MRIIAGRARGTRLAPVPEGTRPMLDRVREGLFSSLAERVRGARALDLYSGTGAVGIETLSRGAEHVSFVERDPKAVEVIRDNLRRTKFDAEGTGGTVVVAEVIRREVLAYLGGRPEPVELVFLDAPYGLEPKELDAVMERLADGWLMPGSGWTVMLSRSPKSYTPVVPIGWDATKRLSYGDTVLTLYREA